MNQFRYVTKTMVSKSKPVYQQILNVTIDGSVLDGRENVTINSQNFIKAMEAMGIKVKESELIPGKGLVIKIKNVL
jgi:hypothetical protein